MLEQCKDQGVEIAENHLASGYWDITEIKEDD